MDVKLVKKVIDSRKKAIEAFDTYHQTETTNEENLKKQYKPIINELLPIKSSIDDQKSCIDKQI